MTRRLLALTMMAFIAAVAFAYAVPNDASQPVANTGVVVEKIDLNKKLITIRNPQTNAKKDLWYGEKTVFTFVDQTGKIDDVKKGMTVSIVADEFNMIETVHSDVPLTAPVPTPQK